jgi:hypothetical protein
MRRSQGLRWIAVLTLLLPTGAFGQDQPPNPHEKKIAELSRERARVAVREIFVALCIRRAQLDIARIADAETEELAGDLAILAYYRLRKVHSALLHMENDRVEKRTDTERQMSIALAESDKLDDEMLATERLLWREMGWSETLLPRIAGTRRKLLQIELKSFSSSYASLKSVAADVARSRKDLDRRLSEERKLAAEFDRNP